MKQLVLASVTMFFVIFSFMAQVSGGDPKPMEKTGELMDLGKKLYDQSCAVCHGLKGDGKTPVGNSLTPPPSDFANALQSWPNTKGDPQKIFEVTTKGIPGSAMPGWSQLSEKERWGLVYYMMEFSKVK